MVETIGEAIILVVLVVILFLQTWRAAIIPIVAIPVSLVGTFFFMALFGFTLNNLSLFGLVLAIGIWSTMRSSWSKTSSAISRPAFAARGGLQEHGRGRCGADCDCAGAVRGVRSVRLHHRHFRPILPAIRSPSPARRSSP